MQVDLAGCDKVLHWLQENNAGLEPESLRHEDVRRLFDFYSRLHKLAAFGMAALAPRMKDASAVAKASGVSLGRAKETVATGEVMKASTDLSGAFANGSISLDQATTIAKAEASAPGAAGELLKVAAAESFHVLKERARAVALQAEQHRCLAERQHEARSARSYSDDLGMVHIHLALEPHVGTPIVARGEAEAQRRARTERQAVKARGGDLGRLTPFEAHLADAYAALLSGAGKGRAKRPELVVLVSHEVAKRGWKDVRAGEICKIPGIGPVAPQVAKEIAQDAFLTGVLFDGTDLRQLKRWTRNRPVEVSIALELGDAPEFDGVKCIDCGNRFRTEFDHLEPHVAGGPASSTNLKPRCWPCHLIKTRNDRAAGKLKPPSRPGSPPQPPRRRKKPATKEKVGARGQPPDP